MSLVTFVYPTLPPPLAVGPVPRPRCVEGLGGGEVPQAVVAHGTAVPARVVVTPPGRHGAVRCDAVCVTLDPVVGSPSDSRTTQR